MDEFLPACFYMDWFGTSMSLKFARRGSSIDAQRLFEGFENLMPFRVRDILLVSSLYDSFILREDGRLNELLIGESLELNLQQIPGITQVSTGAEALALARSQSALQPDCHQPSSRRHGRRAARPRRKAIRA